MKAWYICHTLQSLALFLAVRKVYSRRPFADSARVTGAFKSVGAITTRDRRGGRCADPWCVKTAKDYTLRRSIA